MKKIIIGCLLSILMLSAYSQENKNGPRYHTWIKYMDNTPGKKGYLVDLTDLNISFLPNKEYQGWIAGNGNLGIKIPIENIRLLQFRRTNKGIRCMLKGGVIVGGGTLFYAATFWQKGLNDPYAKPVILGAAVIGSLIGGVIGLKQTIIPINGNLNTYKSQQERIKNFMLPEY